MLEPPPIPNTNQPERRPKRGRMILIAVVVLLAAFAVWKAIDYWSEPPVPAFVSTPERVDALRYLAAANSIATAAGAELEKSDLDMSYIFREIAETQARAGDIARARATAKAINKADLPTFILIAVSAAQAEMGDPAGAKATVRSLSSSADEFINEAFVVAARTQARRGDIAGAKATANIITDRASKAEALSGIAAVQAKRGDVNGAIATASAITDNDHQASALAEIGAAQAKAGDKAAAAQSLTQAEALTNGTKDSFARSGALRDLAVAQARTGDVVKAKVTARVVGTLALDSPSAWQGIAKAQAKTGDIAGAKETANLSPDKHDKALALSDVAAVQARSGDGAGASQTFAEAKAAAGPLAESYKGMTWCEIAAAQARAGDITAAQATINSVTEEGFRTKAFSAIAFAQAKAGDLPGARATINAIPSIELYEPALFTALVAIVQLQAGREGFPATEQWIQNLSEPRARILYYIALAKARLNSNGTHNDDSEDEG